MRYRFGHCELRTDSRELVVDGAIRSVEPQVFDLLCLLASRAGHVVSHDELMEIVWGGRIVSDSAVSARISAARVAVDDDGTTQRIIKTVQRRGFRLACEVVAEATSQTRDAGFGARHSQEVRFCRSRDGTHIAYAATGSGYPLVKAGHWLTHLEYDWHSPIWRPFLDRLSSDFRVIRYDQRGNGLSDWEVETFSLDRFVDDLEAVTDAAGLDRFALYGTSQGAPIALAYARRFPERVSHLILQGGYKEGRLVRASEAERASGDALLTLIRHGWGKPGSALVKAFASLFVPDGTKEEIDALAELQRITASPQNAARIREAVDHFDVGPFLGDIRVPTLVLHARNDGVQPLDQGRALAAGITNAQFVLLESANHVVLPHEPAWAAMFDAIARFISVPASRAEAETAPH
jgi:pimeloyl-ACP methyl ester carboxylesterase/DNA-binding winged helix-turn-helix (wHTH) protein